MKLNILKWLLTGLLSFICFGVYSQDVSIAHKKQDSDITSIGFKFEDNKREDCYIYSVTTIVDGGKPDKTCLPQGTERFLMFERNNVKKIVFIFERTDGQKKTITVTEFN